MKYILPYGMTIRQADKLVKNEFKKRYGISYGEWSMRHKDNAILAVSMMDGDITLTICGVLPPEVRKSTMTIEQFKFTVDSGDMGVALADLKQSLMFWQKTLLHQNKKYTY